MLVVSGRSAGWQGVTDGNAMTVGCADRKFAHIPWLVSDFGTHIGSFGGQMAVVAVGVFDPQVGKVAVAAQFAGVHVIWALTEHDHAVVFLDEYPARRLSNNLEAEHLNVEICGPADVVDGEDVVILDNGRHQLQPNKSMIGLPSPSRVT